MTIFEISSTVQQLISVEALMILVPVLIIAIAFLPAMFSLKK